MNGFRKEGIELVIENLKKSEDYDAEACIHCYEFAINCRCANRTLWPVRHLILKLELENE